MNDTRLLPDDPRLTAYALGELTVDERAAVEAALRQQPELSATVDEIRATVAQFEAALAAEAAEPATGRVAPYSGLADGVDGHATATPPARPRRRPAVAAEDDPPNGPTGEIYYSAPRTGSKLFRFPQFYYLAGGLAAACVAVLVALRDEPAAVPSPVTERTVRWEIALSPPESAPAELSATDATARSALDFRLAGSGVTDAVVRSGESSGTSTGGASAYSHRRDDAFLTVAHNPLSTFSIDSDTASYANVRHLIDHGLPPPREAVRIEELLNYFPYRYTPPRGREAFAASLEVADAPWARGHKLVRVGLKAREVTTAQRAAANLVFLIDVSGSMDEPDRLPLVKQSLRLLLGALRSDDRVAIVTYAGSAELALASTPVARSGEILNALDVLIPGGSSNGVMGIQLAYDIAKAHFAADGINRVILCTDGDFNVGTTGEAELARLIEEKAGSGVFLTVLGFGLGDYNDATLEKLAGKGNGNYGYIDTRREAEKLLVEQVSSTLVTVATDVKVQVEFNPAKVHSYRLIGHENRLFRQDDFSHDTVDAGELGAGVTVTALYEIVPVSAEGKLAEAVPPVDALKYAAAARGAVGSRLEMPAGGRDPFINELLTVKVRFKQPDSPISWPRALEFPLVDATTSFARASADFRFAAAVAQFGMILRGSLHRGDATLADVGAWAAAAATTSEEDPGGYRHEFIDLVRRVQTLME